MKESDNWKLILTLRIGSEVFPAKHFSCITCQSNKIFFPHFVILQVWMSLIGPLREVWEPCPHRYSAQNSRCLKQNVRKKKKKNEDETVDDFEYFARLWSQDVALFFRYHPQRNPKYSTPVFLTEKMEVAASGWPTVKESSLFCCVLSDLCTSA